MTHESATTSQGGMISAGRFNFRTSSRVRGHQRCASCAVFLIVGERPCRWITPLVAFGQSWLAGHAPTAR